MSLKQRIISLWFLMLAVSYAQLDTIRYQWPVPPLNSSQYLTATFSEYRNTLSSDHFHNAIDIAEPDGNPVYPCITGYIHEIVSSGSNSYVSVRSQHNGLWKRITYLHMVPNPQLSTGSLVTKGQTILGTIYSGMGHVHLIERELVSSPSSYAVEINNIRPGGGLDPFYDTFTPVIVPSSIQFKVDGEDIYLPSHGLAGKLDIIIRVEERNGTSSSHTNNGTYILGYRIFSSDTSTVVFEPHGDGIKYKFDTKPSNSYVHNVFVDELATLSDPVYYLTNGDGQEYINQTGVVNNNFFDTMLLDEGDYLLEIFSEDTRGNTTHKYFPITITRDDIVPPGFPELLAVVNHNGGNGLTIKWTHNSEPDILGYRLYYSTNTTMSDWALAGDETMLTKDINEYVFESSDDFIVPPGYDVHFFYLTAVDSTGNESKSGDIYARSSYPQQTSYPKALIVDGFDRFGGSGSWNAATHKFATSYFIPLTLADSLIISTCANDAVWGQDISLNDYDMVFWFLGDESTTNKTFSAAEQLFLSQYLENGGSLFVSGSEVGWDLDRSHSASTTTDTLFYRHYLKATLVDDGAANMSTVRGTPGSLFEENIFNIGQIYPEDYPDDIDPVNGSSAIMEYNVFRSGTTYRKAGVAYSGTFGEGIEPGRMIYISFPLETVSSINQQTQFLAKALEYFLNPTGVEEEGAIIPDKFSLAQNYPNPFNPATNFKFSLPLKEKISLKIYDILGREIAVLIDKEMNAGTHEISWDASRFASGAYFAQLRAGKKTESISLMLLK